MVEPYISTRIYETDNLISPSGSKGICQSPNATILSHLENNCKSFREIQSNNDLDGMSHNPLQKPQDTLISLPKEEIVDEYIIQKEPNQHVILEQTNKKMSQTRKLSDKFNSLGVIVPLKHGFDPQNSNDIKEEPNGQIQVDNRLHNEMNPLILTDERIIPKRSVSIIRKSDSIESPRKVSNQSTKTQQQLTPKPAGKRKQQQQLNSGRKSMAIQSNSPNQTSVSPLRTRSGKVVPFGLNDDTGNERQSSTKQNMLGSMKKSIRFSGFGAEPSMQGSNATGSFKQQYPSGILISPVNTISPKLRDDRKVSPSVSPMLKSQTNENNGVANMIWKWGIASRVKMINRFYQRVKNQTSQLNFKFLQRYHYELIDDKAHFYDGSQVSSQSQSSKSQQQQFNPYITAQMCWIIQRYILNIPMLSANSRLLTIWRLIYSFLLVFQMFLVPFQICFDIAFNSGNDGYLLYYGPLIAYCFNILVQLNSGYYEMGQEQLDRGKVLQNYKYQFFIDLLAIFAFILTNTFNNPYFNICFYLKMNQLYTNISDIVEHFQINQKFSLLYTLSRLVFLILFLAHACGCVFLLISQSEFDDGNEQTWIAMSNIQYASTFKRYLNSLYFSVITMVTVGYGDIRPIADTEKMFVIFMALLGSVVFGYVVNTIGGIFQELAQKEADFKKKKYDLSNFMTSRQIKQETQVKVMKQLDYIKMQDEDNPLRGENFLELVSKNLQEDIQREFYGRILLQHKIFSTHFTVSFLNAISLLFKERVLGPGEMFFEQGSVGQNDIYFIQKGKVEIFYVNGSSTKDLIVNKQGEYFGQREFFSSLPRSSSAKSMTNSHVLVLSQAKFISLLKDYPQDFEMFHKLKDDLLLYNISENNKACTSCGKFNHTLIDCHYLHYKKNHDLLIARYSYSVPSQREKSFIRGFQKTQNALKEKKEVNRNLRKYRIDIFEELLVQEFMAIDEDERQEKLQPNVRRKSLMEVSDRKFFMMLKKMKYEDEKFVLCSDEDDLENSLGNITEISQSEDDRQNEYSDENEFNEGEDDGEGEEEDQEENSEFTEGGDIQEREEEEEDDTSGKHTSKVRKQSKKDLTVVQELTSVRKGSYTLGNGENHGTGQGEISTIMEVDESKKGSQTGNIFQDKLLEYIETLPKVEETKHHKEEGDQEEDNDDKSEKLSKSQLPPSSDSSQTSSSSSLGSLPPPEEQVQDNNQYVPSERNSIEQKEIDSQERTKKDIKENVLSSSSASSSSQSDSSSDSDTEYEDSSKNYQTKTVIQEQSHKKIKSSKSKSTNNNHHKHHELQLQKKKHTHNTQPASQLNNNNNNNNNTNNSNTASFTSVPQDFSQSNSNSKGADSGGVSQNNQTSSQSQKSISLRNNTNKNSSRSNSSNKKHHRHHPHKQNSNILNSFNKEQDNMNVVQGEIIQIQPSEEIQIPEDEVDSNILFNNLIEIAEVEGEQQQQINPVSQVITSSKILPAVQEEDYQQKRSEKSKGFQRQRSKVLTFHRSSKIAPPSSSRLEDVENGASFFRGIASEEEGSNNLKKPSSALTATFIPQSPVSREEYSSLQQEFSSLQQEFSAFQQSQQILAQQQQRQSQSMGVSLNHNYSKSSRKYSSSPMSEPSLFSERLKKKSFLTRDQSFKSKLSRESKLLRACDLDDLAPFKNKTPLQKMNSGRGSRFSNAFAEWNATPILKNINGIRDSSDIESSLSLGMFSPMRSFNLKKGQNLGHSFSRNSYQMTSDDEQQHINGLNSMILNNQNQSISQNNGNIKKSKFSNVTRRRSISEDIKLVQGIQGHNSKQSQQGTKNGSLQIQQNLSAGNIVLDPQQKQQQLQQLQQPFGVLPNIERIKQEQERMRRNSPLLVTRNNIISGRRQSVLSSNYNQFRNSLVSSNSNTSGIQNSTLLGGGSIAGSLINGVTPNNKNSTLGNLPANNLPQNELNEEHLVRRLKELLQRQEDDKTPVEGLYSQRGSRMYGVGQDYLMNPLLLDYNMFFMPDFDVMKEYEFYYKNNNYSQVIRKIKGKQKNKRLLYQRVQKKKLLTVYKAHSSTKIDS